MKSSSNFLKDKEKILDFARELYQESEITRKQLNEIYFHNFMKWGKAIE